MSLCWNFAFAEDADYGAAYTPAELAALDKALWTQNLTRTDLNFDKDFGKGHACFPVVREMMADPLSIASILSEDLAKPRIDSEGKVLLETAAFISRFERIFKTEPDEYSLSALSGSMNGTILKDVHPKPFNQLTRKEVLDQLTEMIGPIKMGRAEPVLLAPFELYQLADKRSDLISSMVWHPVDGGVLNPEANNEEIFDLISQLDMDFFIHGMISLEAQWVLNSRYLPKLSPPVFPSDNPLIHDTPHGRICLGTPHDDTYSGDFAVLIDPGGNDTYKHCRIGAAYGKPTPELGSGQVGYFVDLSGDDLYDCADVDITLGAAVLGVAAFYDLGGGNDRYYGGSVSLGAAIGGVATFYDDGGSDHYSGKVYTQGAAGFGIAVMCDDSVGEAPVVATDAETPDPIDLAAFDNDHYTAWCEAQGFARTRGIAICTNARGNEVYHAGGVYLHAPLFTDRYQSFSQGFAIGERDIDYAGGIALLADYGGNDRYLGDVYNQGVGYWYSAGFLYDGGGNDHYEMTQYGQGSGIHLAVGGLIDESGSDTYIMNNGLGQGGSHDYAASVFMDRGGDDRYLGNTSCNGCGLTNSVGLFFDRGGNDVYAGKRDSINTGRPARGFGSIGVLVDLGGTDDYLGRMRDDALWAQPDYGMGIDVGEVFGPVVGLLPEEKREGVEANAGGFDKPSDTLKLPDVIAYKGPLTQAVFDELWELAIRWEVGDNRVIVPAARKKLVAYGADVLPMVAARMGDMDTGLALRAQVDVIKGVLAAAEVPGAKPMPAELAAELYNFELENASVELYAATAAVYAILVTQLASGSEVRVRNAMQIIAELKLTDMGNAIVPLLDSPDPALQRRAVSVLGMIGSHAADEKLLALLNPGTDEKLLKVVVEAVTNLEIDCWQQLAILLDHPSFAVRDTLERQLASHITTYNGSVWMHMFSRDPGWESTLVALLRVWQKSDLGPDVAMLDALQDFVADGGGGEQEVVRLIEHWLQHLEDEQLKAGLSEFKADYLEGLPPEDRVVNTSQAS